MDPQVFATEILIVVGIVIAIVLFVVYRIIRKVTK
jgi:hypothetical protein